MASLSGNRQELQTLAQDYLGPLLIGASINLMLYGITVCWQWQYWRSFKADHWTLRAFVAIQAVSDAVGTLAIFLMVYKYAILNYGNPTSLAIQDWHWSVLIVTTGITAAITHSFLITRMYRLSGKWFITVPLLMLTVIALSCGLWVSSVVSRHSGSDSRHKLGIALCTWVSASILVNILLCLSIVWVLNRLSRLQYINTKHILKRLMLVALITGFILVGVEVGSLVSFLNWPNTNIAGSMLFIIGRLYTLTLLINLNLRHAEAPPNSNLRRFITSPADKAPPISLLTLQYPALSKIRTADVVRRDSAETVVESPCRQPRSYFISHP